MVRSHPSPPNRDAGWPKSRTPGKERPIAADASRAAKENRGARQDSDGRWDIDAVVVDLDGTLYEGGPSWFAVYAEETARHDPEVDPELLAAEAQAVVRGERPLRIGDFHDPATDLVVRTSGWCPSSACTWEGQPAELPPDLDPAQALPWDTRLTYVGDAFQAFGATAAHLRVPPGARNAAFAAMRHRMNAEQEITVPAVTAADLERAFGRARLRVLATNTGEALARGLVERLEVASFFDEVRYGAGKPHGLVTLLTEVAERAGCAPERVLCVGDSFWNDVLPAVVAGCQHAWVDTHGSAAHEGSHRVQSLAELCSAAPPPGP